MAMSQACWEMPGGSGRRGSAATMSVEQAHHCVPEDGMSKPAPSRARGSKLELGLHPMGVEEWQEQTYPLC